jgi:hypothetical protein
MNTKIAIMDSTGKWEVNELALPLVTNYKNPVILLFRSVPDIVTKLNESIDVDFINALKFGEKLQLCYSVLFKRKFTIKTKITPMIQGN